jgi:nucleoside-diphosphate-sugar epimerase
MSILITGGSGLIGASLMRMIVELGERPAIFDIAPSPPMLKNIDSKFKYFQGSLDHLPELLNIIKTEEIDTIFHLGGMLSMPSEEKPWASFQSNVVGTFNVLEAARLEKVDRVIYSSTIATYSKDIQSDVIDDFTLQRPTTMYGATKVFGELLGRVYARKYGIDFRAVRFPSVIGPGAKTAHMSIYHAWAIEEPLKGNPYEIYVEPETRVPAIYFKDAVRALWLLSRARRKQIPTMVYIIAGITPPYSAKELAEVVRSKIPGAHLTFKPDPALMELVKEIGTLRFNEERAQSEWGWRVSYSLPEMVDDFIEEFNEAFRPKGGASR